MGEMMMNRARKCSFEQKNNGRKGEKGSKSLLNWKILRQKKRENAKSYVKFGHFLFFWIFESS